MLYYVRDCKVTGLEQYVSALNNWSLSHNLGELPRNYLYQKVRRGIHNFFGLSETTTPKHALSLDDLYAMRSHMDLSQFLDARDWCAYVFAFFGLLRLREYTDGRLQFQHVQRFHWGIQLTIPFSKTSLQPVHVKLASRPDSFCPLKAFDAYVLHIPSQLHLPSSPFFRSSATTTDVLSAQTFVRDLKFRVSRYLRRDPDPYAGHSFRRGGTTALLMADVPETIVAAHGRWRSDAYKRYFEFRSSQQLLPTLKLYMHTRGKYI